MAILENLKGVKKSRTEFEYINDSSEIQNILSEGKACSAAGDNGAINIYKDDKGVFRCEAMRFRVTIEEKRLNIITDVIEWADTWLDNIK
ncbi:hypothetical protein CEY12_06105 [Chryseobacterium sp. T16E-39]|uniref:hypothetical protein n=1 Tax=Chryseobacterium sp. T16E-39 TaxID=2015076 RepID=UPI000B5B0FE9|nr:hypothetical protein [Chryseobacterium sp. T16E-39]ASK29701.1 hypothetical protein CEY12_06105 [Chryseobacterium sp. T16E-39]